MNDKDFDKIFNDHLKEDLPFPDADKDWEQLTHRLDDYQTGNKAIKNRQAFWRRVLWSVLGLLLLMNAWQLWRSNTLMGQNEQLLTQLTALESRLPVAIHRDTIVVRRVDTVYLTRTEVRKVYVPMPSATDKFLSSSESALDRKKSEKDESKPISDSNQSVKNTGKTAFEAGKMTAADDKSALNTVPTSVSAPLGEAAPTSKTAQSTPSVKNDILVENPQISALTETIKKLETKLQVFENQYLANVNSPSNVLQNDSTKQLKSANVAIDSAQKRAVPPVTKTDEAKKSPLSISETLPSSKPQTRRLFVGINGGLINYAVKWYTGQGVEIGKKERSYQVGLKAEYALTDRLRVVIGGDFCPFEFQTYWRDSRYNLPDPQPTAWEKYNSAKARQELVQGFGGLKYMLTNGRAKWRPFVEVAYASMLVRPFETTFEYQNRTTSATRTETIQSPQKTIGKLLMGGGGVEYRWHKNWVSQAEAYYYYDLNRPRRTYDLFGVRGSVFFNF